jgi:M6 family metalloprotease-like protein
VIFAKFHGESPDETRAPDWATDIFDPRHPGSFTHFYEAMSFGQLRPEGETTIFQYESERESDAYTSEDATEFGEFGRFSLEILQAADREIDFSRFDNDGPDEIPDSGDDDAVVDLLFIVTASAPANFIRGPATGAGTLGFAGAYTTDDVGRNGRAIRILPSNGTLQRGRSYVEAVGSMCHEYGHILGLPDLYNTAFLRAKGAEPADDSAGIGAWGLMGWGALGWHGDDGPNSLSAWSREKLRWARVEEVTMSPQALRLEPAATGALVRIPLTRYEYFLLEYRTRSSSFYERNLPAEGVLVWHVREIRTGPGAGRTVVDLECADGRYLDAGYPVGTVIDSRNGGDNLDFWAHDQAYAAAFAGNLGDATDPFDGVRAHAFTPDTNPDSYDSSRQLSIRIQDIRLEDEVAFAEVSLGPPPDIEVTDLSLHGALSDSFLLHGEEVEVWFGLVNRASLPATNVSVVLSSDDELVDITRSTVRFRDLPFGRETKYALTDSGVVRPFLRLRFTGDFSGRHQAELLLEVRSDQGLVGSRSFQVSALSPRQVIRAVAVVDSLGNNDGAIQAGEIVGLDLNLGIEPPSMLNALHFTLRPIGDDAVLLSDPAVEFSDQTAVSTIGPEFLISGDLPPGHLLAFELAVASPVGGTWRDTLSIAVEPGSDPTAPRLGVPSTRLSDAGLSLLLPAAEVVEGSDVIEVTALLYDLYGRQGSPPIAQVPLLRLGDRFEGLWKDVFDGIFLLQARAVDRVGNVGVSPTRTVVVGLDDPVRSADLPTIGVPRGRLTDVQFSPDGSLLAVASRHGIQLYDAETLSELTVLEGNVKAIGFSPNMPWLAAGLEDGSLQIWDIAKEKSVATLAGHTGRIHHLAYSSDGSLLATAGRDNLVLLWDAEPLRLIGELEGLGNAVGAVAFSADGRFLAAGSHDKTVRIWDPVERRELGVLEGHRGQVEAVAFHPHRSLLASGGGPNNRYVRVWDVTEMAEIFRLQVEADVNDITFSADGQLLAFGGTGSENPIRVWDMMGQVYVAILRGDAWLGSLTMAFSPDAQTLVWARDRSVRVWDLPVRHTQTAITEQQSEPRQTRLMHAYPNPFNSMTLIPYTIAQEHRATLTIYNLLGQQVRLLVDEKQQPGRYEVVWRGVDDSGNSVGNGVYFYMLRAGNERRVRRVALVK